MAATAAKTHEVVLVLLGGFVAAWVFMIVAADFVSKLLERQSSGKNKNKTKNNWHTWHSFLSTFSVLSVLSAASLLGGASFLSVASIGSIASFGSVGSIASVNSIGSIGCVNKAFEVCTLGSAGNEPVQMNATAEPEAEPGQARFTFPGNYSWTAEHSGSVSVVAVGGGGGGGYQWSSGGGGGGGLGWIKKYEVTKGKTYKVVVGNGGACLPNAGNTAGTNGGTSYFVSTNTVAGYGGGRGGPNGPNGPVSKSPGHGGGFKGDGGGRGGKGGRQNWMGGGGGAGGYNGAGGDALGSPCYTNPRLCDAPSGSGGGGGGGVYSSTYGTPAGGGVGIYGALLSPPRVRKTQSHARAWARCRLSHVHPHCFLFPAVDGANHLPQVLLAATGGATPS
jgi:hypothetical protein